MNVAEYLIQQLTAWGVRHVYGVTGDAILPFMDALGRSDALRFIPVAHESAAGFMAAAEAKLTGRLALCVATSGPGVANLINGLGDAYADRVPVLSVTGQVESSKSGTRAKQYVNQQALLAGIAGFSELLASPQAFPGLLLRALKIAVGEGRVAQISVPKDYWLGAVAEPIHPPEPYLTAPPVVATDILAEAARRLEAAHRPLILVGDGARSAAAAVANLADRLDAGVVAALGGRGIVADGHPLMLGGVGLGGSDAAHQALQEADLILVAGSTWWPQGYMPKGVKVIQADRQPAAIGAMGGEVYGLPGDLAQVLPGLLSLVRDGTRPAWRQRLAAWRSAWCETQDREAAVAADGPIHPAQLVRALERAVPDDALIALDTGDHLLWLSRHFRRERYRLLFSGRWRSMGYGLPAAIAAGLCQSAVRPVALVGDGSLTMLLGELRTAVQEGLDLTVVVARNGSLALEEHKAASEGLKPFGHTLRNPDFSAVARAFGWTGWRVENLGDLAAVLPEAMTTPGPTLVDVWTGSAPLPTMVGGGES